MKLKSLEIKGFKSFPDKINLDLDNAVTGIVGPNGCGKSNIIDAIRWVIGEHKIRSLRSDSLDDLIFNGSKGRPASGMAEVSITFENTKNVLPTEFTTVTITRKFFKTGESEYRLNGVVCRLKDIRDLLMDTGISSDSYAIIELNMVDDIIRDKEGSRRRMLEQAAGITVYKQRKREAEQKLTATDLDIDRIEDLLFEIANNLKSLEQQARRAERYYQLRTEYKELSIEFAKLTLGDFNTSYQDLQQKKNQYIDEKTAVEASIAGEEASIQERKNVLVDKEQELHYQQKKFNDLVSRIRVLESERKLASQHLQHLKDREQSLSQIITQAKQQLTLIEEQQEDLVEKIEDQIDRMLFVEEQVEDEQEKFNAVQGQLKTYREAVEEARKAVELLQQRRFEIEKEVAIQSQTSDSFKQQIERIQKQMEEIQAQLAHIASNEKVLTKQKEDIQRNFEEAKKQAEIYENELSELKESVEAKEKEIAQSNRVFDARTNEYALLKSLVASMEGYSDSIQYLEEQRKHGFKGILLSELFKVPNALAAMIETYYGDVLNYYVVDTYQEAYAGLEMLKKEEKGKVGFWIMEELNASQYENPAPSIGKSLLSFMEFDPKYQSLFSYLFKDVLVIEEWKDDYLKKYASSVFFNLEDFSIARHGSVYGGHTEEVQNLKIGRSFRIEALEEELEVLKNNLSQWTGELQNFKSNIKEKQALLAQIPLTKLERDLSQCELQLPLIQQRKEETNLRFEKLDEEQKEMARQMEKMMEGQPDHQKAYEVLLSDLDQAQQVLANKNQALQVQEGDVEQQQQALQMLRLSLQQEKSKESQLKQEQVYKQQQFKDVSQQIALQTEQLKEAQQKISETDGKINFGIDELDELLDKKEIDEAGLNNLDKEYYAFRNKITEDEQAIAGVRKKKEQLDVLIKGVEDAIGQMKLQVAGIKERLTVEFNLDLEEILEEAPKLDHSLEDLNALIEKNKRRLENIGAVNPTAIEAYQEIKLRHDFIQTQKKDLLDAKESLEKTIEEVERNANEKFKETFDAVRENFVKVFKSLFTEEDHADLRLTDPDDIANTNIEIYAQPKGKRPSTLTQLSGGEKTLTSTAFLFAIYLIKPAPFCILDEVDAPLDDANVLKFTNMIREFSDNSQFIMVTHNKQTMASVDVIYGVTMQEAGVSKIVPVDFRSLAN